MGTWAPRRHPIMFCHMVVLETRHDLPKKSCRQTPDLASWLHKDSKQCGFRFKCEQQAFRIISCNQPCQAQPLNHNRHK